MIAGIGIDIVEIERFKKLMERFGQRIVERILTEREIEQFERRQRSATFLSSRFAAKEAASKALGKGIAAGLSFHSFEVSNDDLGKPQLQLLGAAHELAESMQVSRSLLSLSDEKHYAVAMVILETD